MNATRSCLVVNTLSPTIYHDVYWNNDCTQDIACDKQLTSLKQSIFVTWESLSRIMFLAYITNPGNNKFPPWGGYNIISNNYNYIKR